MGMKRRIVAVEKVELQSIGERAKDVSWLQQTQSIVLLFPIFHHFASKSIAAKENVWTWKGRTQSS